MASSSGNSNDVIIDIKVKYNDAIQAIIKYRKEIEDLKKSNKDLSEETKENTKQTKERETVYKKGKVSVVEFTDDTKKSTKVIAENTAQTEANNIEIQRKSAAIRLLQNEIKANIKIESEQKKSINAITAELSLLNREYEKLGEGSERDALGSKIKSLQSDLNKVNAERGRFQGQVGNYENAIKNALGLNNQFANSLMNLSNNTDKSGSKLKSFASEGAKSVQAFGKALMGLMANPVFLSIAGIAGAGVAFKFWYDYNKGLIEATRLTKQFTGLAGSELKEFRNQVQGIADTFNADFKNTLTAANALSKQFGISQQESLKAIQDGFVSGANINGDFLDTVKEYSAYFKEAGLSASQFIAITSQTANQGIFSDKGIDAIKEANIRIREMTTSTASALDGIGISSTEVQQKLQDGSTTTFDVMKQVSDKLNQFPEQSSVVGTAIADIFGGAGEDAGLQYLKTLKDIDTNLDSVKTKAGELATLQEDLLNANVGLQNAVADLFDYTDGSFEKLTTSFKIFLTQSLTQFLKDLKSIKDWFVQIYEQSRMIQVAVNSLTLSFKAVWSVVEAVFKIIGAIFTYIVDILKAIATFDFSNLDLSLKNLASSVYKTFTSMFSDLWNAIVSFASDVEKLQASKLKPLNTKATLDTVRNNVLNSRKTTTTTDKTETKNTNASKANDDANKAALELAKFRVEQEAKTQKQLADSQQLGQDERLKALQSYYNIQRAYIIKDQELQLKTAANNESQKQLIKEKSNLQLLELDKELSDGTKKIADDQIQIFKSNINLRLGLVKSGSDEELALKLKNLQIERDAEIANAEKTGLDVSLVRAKYIEQENQARKDQLDYLAQQRQTAFDNELIQAQLNNQSTLQLELANVAEQLASIKQLETESDIDFMNRKLELQYQLKSLNDEMKSQTIDAITSITSSFTDFFSSLGEQSEGFAALSKATALVEIGINQAVAMAAGIKSAMAVKFPANLAAIGTTIAAVLSAFTKVNKVFSSATSKSNKYATGGLVTGAGSGTSDSINARLSNGESVMTAAATAQFAPILSMFNQVGGGVPIQTQDVASQVQGEDMLTNSFAKALALQPNPVVSVQEIQTVNTRVGVLEIDSTL